jgi:solute:Na+ symporter, SSS family
MTPTVQALSGLATPLPLNAQPVDYVLVVFYFAIVLGIGLIARRGISDSVDFLLSGRSLPAWVTGLAFMSANLGATELLGQTANGAQYGEQTFHYYWVGAVPAMVFLGLVMMPFYYGSGVRSVPEYLGRRFNSTTQRFQAVLFAVASVLLAGVNLYAMAIVVNALLGWPTWLAILGAAVVVLMYTFLGGLSAAIYNEVLQLFVIVATMVPITLVGLHRVGGWHGLTHSLSQSAAGKSGLHPFPAHELTGISSTFGSVLGVVLGLGFVTSFGYWTTNFTEVQRAFSARSASAGQRTPLIAAIPKTLIAFVIVIPGMIAAVLVPGIAALKAGHKSSFQYNDVVPVLLHELLPNGFLGVAIAGLLASFMAGMAANVSSLNTVVVYDLWQDWLHPDQDDAHYLWAGRVVTIGGTVLAVGTAFIAAGFSNIMDYIQTLFSFFNVPLFAVFIIGLFWKRMTGTAGWSSLLAGTTGAVVVFILNRVGVVTLSGQGSSFLGGGVGFVLAAITAVAVSYRTTPKSDAELEGLARAATSKEQRTVPRDPGWFRSPVILGGGILALTAGFYVLMSV